MNIEQRIQDLDKENAELKRELEERQMCLRILVDRIHFKNYIEEINFQKIRDNPKRLRENLELLEPILPVITIEQCFQEELS